MSDEIKALEVYTRAGLSVEEAKEVQKWVEEGKPGLAVVKAEQLLTIYINGYSCQDIHRQFPQYPLPLLLWARATYRWDEARDHFRQQLSEQVVQTALTARADSLRFITDLLSATHLKLRKEILAYMADPENVPPPSLLPVNVKEYALLAEILKESMSQSRSSKGEKDGIPGAALNINIHTSEEKGGKPIISVNPLDVKAALKAELEKKQKS
jgi:hypothetical protein